MDACPTNTTSPAGSSAIEQCSSCTTGNYKNGPTSCAACPPGSYCINSNQIPCPIGTYSSSPGVTVCTPCPKGTFASTIGQSLCTNCPAGQIINTTNTSTTYATTATGSNSIYNCSCGYTSLKLPDGNCKGLCVSGTYLLNQSDDVCTPCPKGSYCTLNIRTTCPAGQSSAPRSSACTTCAGPGTNSDISLAMCGLITCPASTAVQLQATPWYGLGRLEVSVGGNGIIPRTPWVAGDKVFGLMLNSTADRPVSLAYQTISVTANKTYALRFKTICTGAQCGAAVTVVWYDGASATANTLYTSSSVARSWLEIATPYFTPTSSSIKIQFKAQMVTSTATIWLAAAHLADLGQWAYQTLSKLQLTNGVNLPKRYSSSYVEYDPIVQMQLSTTYIQHAISPIAGQDYQLSAWTQGTVAAQWSSDGSVWTALSNSAAIDTWPSWTQSVWRLTPSYSSLIVRLAASTTALVANPVFSLYQPASTMPCLDCLANYWCKGTVINQCPLHTLSLPGSSDQTDCYCQPGYFGLLTLGDALGFSPCSICPMNSYCTGGNSLITCADGFKSSPGSSVCDGCQEGQLCVNGTVGGCPANSYTLTGASRVEDCICNPGYYGVAPNCVECEVGYYCPGGASRHACTPHAVSPVGSTDSTQCFCDRGWYGVSNAVCTACPEASWCWTGIENACPQHMWSPMYSSFQVNCTCNAGYTGANGGPCSSCSKGQYKDHLGTDACALCAVGTSSNAIAATDISTCAQCDRGYYNPSEGQQACTACDAGHYVNAFGTTVCQTCVPGTWSATAAPTCTNCLAGRYSTASAATSVATCTLCAAGNYAITGSTTCSACGACDYWTWPTTIRATLGGSTTQVASIALTSLAQRSPTTAIGADHTALYTVDLAASSVTAIAFTPTDPDSIFDIAASSDGLSIYIVQSAVYRLALSGLSITHEYVSTSPPYGVAESLDGASVWVATDTGLDQFDANLETKLATIALPAGSTGPSLPCFHSSFPSTLFAAGPQPFGFRKYVGGQWITLNTNQSFARCQFVPDGKFVVLTASSGAWLWRVSDGGLALQVSTIEVDAVIASATSLLLASPLSTGLVTQPIVLQDSSTCSPGLYSLSAGLASASLCVTCPAGSLCPGGPTITQCTAGTFSLSTGFRSQGQCSICPPGNYCPGGATVNLCPLGSYSLATGVTRALDCNSCPANFYCRNTTSITACPTNTNSPAGSSDLGRCTCNSGYSCTTSQVVHAEITLPLTIQDFEALRTAYIAAVAAAAGVDVSQVIIVSVTTAPGGGVRRLLSADGFITHVEIHTSIIDSRHTSAPHKALVTLDTHLVRNGLPTQSRELRVSLHSEVQRSTAKAHKL